MVASVWNRSTGAHGRFTSTGGAPAAIPAGLAERLLFGARRGAYSGAVEHADGYAKAADGGTDAFVQTWLGEYP